MGAVDVCTTKCQNSILFYWTELESDIAKGPPKLPSSSSFGKEGRKETSRTLGFTVPHDHGQWPKPDNIGRDTTPHLITTNWPSSVPTVATKASHHEYFHNYWELHYERERDRERKEKLLRKQCCPHHHCWLS